ncbi:MAG: hypothetical protein ACKVVP_19890 [Chloroflexota bacterium]
MYRLGLITLALTFAVACAPSAQAPAKPSDAPQAAAQPTAAPAAPAQAAKPAVAKPPAQSSGKPTNITNDYFAGKTIRIIVGIEPGANGDIQARYMAQSLSKFIPGEPSFTVTNMPGASGLTATNYIAAQPPDGLTLYWGTGGSPHQQLEQGTNAKFKYDELVRVATLEGRTALWLGLGSMPYKRIQDAVGGDKEFTVGMLSEKDSADLKMLKEWLKLPVRFVYGIETGLAKVLLAFDRKDVDSMVSGSGWYQIPSQRPGWFTERHLEPLVVLATLETKFMNNGETDLPADVKNIRELLTPEQRRDYELMTVSDGPFYRNSYLPPGTPTEVRDIVSDAIAAALKDPEWMNGFVKINGRPPDGVIMGAELDKIAKSFKIQDLDALLLKWTPGYKSAL